MMRITVDIPRAGETGGWSSEEGDDKNNASLKCPHLWNEMSLEVVSSLKWNKKSRLVNGKLKCLWTITVCHLVYCLPSCGLFCDGPLLAWMPTDVRPVHSRASLQPLCSKTFTPRSARRSINFFASYEKWKFEICAHYFLKTASVRFDGLGKTGWE